MAIVTPEWVKDAVFYQIFPDRFARSGRVEAPGPLEPWDLPPTIHGFKGGDLYGIADRLEELAELGVTAIYLNPIFASASNHRYHTYDYFQVDPLLGGDAALRELLDRAHERGMKVVLDGVFNHASRGFWPFNHVLECGLGSPYAGWFHLDRERLASGRPLRAYPDDRSHGHADEPLGYAAWWGMPALPKLNTDNPHVREFLFSVAEHWIRFGADGWRLDVAAEIDDDEFWREFRRRVKAIDPDAYIVAEIWHEDHRWLQGDQFDAYMNYPAGFAALSFCAGTHRDQRVIGQQGDLGRNVHHDDAATFAQRLTRAVSAYDPAINAVQLNLVTSHDTPRLRTICADDLDGVRMTLLVLLTIGGAPCIYYGDEVGMQGEHDPACRGAFPDPSGWDRDLRDFVRGAIALRHRHAALRRGAFAFVAAHGTAAAYRRSDAHETFLVCLNAGDEPVDLPLALGEDEGRRFRPVALPGSSWPDGSGFVVANGAARVALAPRSALVLRSA